MILSAHQPAYLPWLGYFEKIARSDIFIFLDAVQFEKNSFINRNKIKTPQGSCWITIPVNSKGHLNTTICDIGVDDSQEWRLKHLKAIQSNYQKAQHFNEAYPLIESIIRQQDQILSELLFEHLKVWLKIFKIKTKVIRLSDLQITTKKSDLVLNLCEYFGAKNYLSGALGKNYIQEKDFDDLNIAVEYQEFNHPIYRQLWGDFIPNMGAVDYLMNCGPGEIKFLREEGANEF